MKKLFTLLVFLTCFLGAKAVEVVDAEVDYSTMADGDASTIKFYGWGASQQAKDRLSIKNGCLHFESSEVPLNDEGVETGWLCQFHPIGGVKAEEGVVYTLHFKIKGDHTQNVSMLGFGLTPYGQFQITDEWVEGSVDYEAKADANGNVSGDILMQCGDYIGTWDIAYLKITHEQAKESKPAEWVKVEELTNGDAESAWPAWALEKEGDINANWRGDKTPQICVWGLTMGRNFDDQCPSDISSDSYRARPFPADIEPEPGNESNHVFAIHVTQIDKIDDDNSIAWSNQFWIQAPKEFKAGIKVKVKFDYKADAPVTVPSQIHKIYPSIYLNSSAIGSLDFTTEWQTKEEEITWPADGWSIAFNLTDDKEKGRVPNNYYIDNVSFEVMKLDYGYFVAGANPDEGLEYDYSTAIEMTEDESDAGVFFAEVGEKNAYVSQIMVSTVRGYDGSFKSNTLKPASAPTKTDGSEWIDYEPGSNAKINLPGSGIWLVTVDTNYSAMSFEMLEGSVKEKKDIKPNPTVVTINGKERDFTSSEQPANEETGVAAGTGQTWDNQFWIIANRPLEADEETILEFDYVATKDALAATGYHSATPGNWLCPTGIKLAKNENGEDADGVQFTTEEQHFSQKLVIPAKTPWGSAYDGKIQSIAFDLAQIKEANDYTFKNVVWKLADDSESLIDETGTKPFWVNIKGVNDNKAYEYGTVDPNSTGIVSVVKNNTGSAVIFNLAGQQVDDNYKGLVIKSGKKLIQK